MTAKRTDRKECQWLDNVPEWFVYDWYDRILVCY